MDDEDFWGHKIAADRRATEPSALPVATNSLSKRSSVDSGREGTRMSSADEEQTAAAAYASDSFESESVSDGEDGLPTVTPSAPPPRTRPPAVTASRKAVDKPAKERQGYGKSIEEQVAKMQLRSRQPLRDRLRDVEKRLSAALAENKTLQRLQRRQESELARLQGRRGDGVPQLIERYTEQIRVLKGRLRQEKEKREQQDRLLRDRTKQLQRAEERLRRGDTDAAATLRASACAQSDEARHSKHDEHTQKIKRLEQHIRLLEKNHRHQMSIEVARHKATKQKLAGAEPKSSKAGRGAKAATATSLDDSRLFPQSKSPAAVRKSWRHRASHPAIDVYHENLRHGATLQSKSDSLWSNATTAPENRQMTDRTEMLDNLLVRRSVGDAPAVHRRTGDASAPSRSRDLGDLFGPRQSRSAGDHDGPAAGRRPLLTNHPFPWDRPKDSGDK